MYCTHTQQLMDAVKTDNIPNCVNILAHSSPEDINKLHGPPEFWAPLHVACMLGRTVIAQLLIWVCQLQSYKLSNVLYTTLFSLHVQMLSILVFAIHTHTHTHTHIQNGGDINILDADRHSPLHYARSQGHQEIVQILIANSCEDTSDTSSVDVMNIQPPQPM